MAIQGLIKAKNTLEIHDALEAHKGNICILAGGTDVCVKIREGHLKEQHLLDISDVPELSAIQWEEEWLSIGAAVKFSEVVADPRIKETFWGLWSSCLSVGAPQIRNMGTLGGNLANGSPAADSAPPLLALDATLRLSSKEQTREVKLSDFYLDKGKTVIAENELLEAILIPLPKKAFTISFAKLGLRNALAISRLSASIYMVLDEYQVIREIRCASGSIGLSPLREPLLEAFLQGKPLNQSTLQMGTEVFSNIVSERLSGRSTCGFKKEAVKGVFLKAMTQTGEVL